MSTFLRRRGSRRNAGSAELSDLYAVVEERKATLKRVAYNVDATIAVLRKAPLPNDVIEGLVEILKPS
jgi:hypothetical protein